MDTSTAAATIFGLILGFVGSTVWYAVRWNAEHEEMLEWRSIAEKRADTIIHLESIVHPEQWLDASDVAINIATKERLYDRHEGLVKPGTEVIRVTVDDDIPNVPFDATHDDGSEE